MALSRKKFAGDVGRPDLRDREIGSHELAAMLHHSPGSGHQLGTPIYCGARDFLASMEGPRRPLIVDVRSAQEWSNDHLEGAVHITLPQLLGHIGGIARNAPLTVVCGSGYRSSIAASLLEREGFDRLGNVMGGMYAVRHAKRPRLPIMELADSAITWEI